MLPSYEFCLLGCFAHLIHSIIAWYAQILWTPTYHITVPAARRVRVERDAVGDQGGGGSVKVETPKIKLCCLVIIVVFTHRYPGPDWGLECGGNTPRITRGRSRAGQKSSHASQDHSTQQTV
jgi:hypothetical protein